MHYRHCVVAVVLCIFVSPAAGVKRTKEQRPAPVETKTEKLPEGARMRLGAQGLVVSLAQYQVMSIAFSGDGKVAAFADGASVRVIETDTLKQICLIPGLTKAKSTPRFLVLSPDSKKLVGSVGATTVVYDVANNKPLFEIKGSVVGNASFAFSADGSRLAVAINRGPVGAIRGKNANIVHVWDVAKGVELFKLEGHEGQIACVGMSPDGKIIATGSHDMSIRLWDAGNGNFIKSLEGHRQSVNCLAFNADGKLLASNGTDGTIRIWNVAKGEMETKIRASYGTGLAFAPDSKSIYQRDFGGLRCWDVATAKEFKCVDNRMGGSFIGLSPNGRIAASALINSIRFWDVLKGEELGASGGHNSPIACLALSADGSMLASSDWTGEILGWDLAAGKQVFAIREHQSTVNALSWPGGKTEILSSSSPVERFVSRWDIKTGRESARYKIGLAAVNGHAVSPDGATLAVSGSDQRIHLFDTATCKQTNQFVVGQINFLTFTPDGKSIAGFGTDGAVKMWNLDGKEVRQIAGQNLAAVRTIAADASTVATRANDGTLRLWDFVSGREIRSWKDDAVNQGLPITLSPDCRMLATAAANGSVKLYETLTGYERRELKGHIGPVMALRFAPDGKSLMSGGIDGSIVVWDAGAVTGDDAKVVVNADEFKQLWADLSSDSGPKAYRSMVLLRQQTKAALPLLQGQVKPAKKLDEKMVAGLFVKLEDQKFEKREEATEELEKISDQIENELRKHLESDQCSEDARKRIQKILDRLESNHLTPDQIRLCRAVEVLEAMGTAEARTVLVEIAKGAESAKSTVEAKAALDRLKK